jgi:hypothetical protein
MKKSNNNSGSKNNIISMNSKNSSNIHQNKND